MATAAQQLSLIARTVHIKIYPVARTFSERTEVLKVLERFGQVEYFKSLRGSGVADAFITIFNKAEAAELVINSSPVRYRLVPASVPDAAFVDPTVTYNRLPNDKRAEIAVLDALKEEEGGSNQTKIKYEPPEEKIFEMRLSHSKYPHHKSIKNSPLYGSWNPIATQRSAIATDLLRRIPSEKILGGLRDWETGAMSGDLDYDNSIDDMDENSGTDNVSSMPWRLRGKSVSTGTPPIRGLSKMYKEYQIRNEASERQKDIE